MHISVDFWADTNWKYVQEKFEERWQALLAPKLAEEETYMRTDAAAVRKQRMDSAQVGLSSQTRVCLMFTSCCCQHVDLDSPYFPCCDAQDKPALQAKICATHT